jgi:hypothetical protein
MAAHTKGKVVYFAESIKAPPLAAHLAAGGQAVVLDGTRVVACRGSDQSELIDTASLAVARTLSLSVTLSDWLAVLGAALALGMTADAVRSVFFQEFGGRTAPLPEREGPSVATVG